MLKEVYTLRNGVSIPKIGFGTAPLKGDEAYQAVKDALSAGYIHIDTAQIYQNEEEVGKALKDALVNREDVFITSKLDASVKEYDNAIQAFNGTLERLQIDYLDLYLIHAPWPWDEKYSNYDEGNVLAYKALETLYKAGKIKAIGVSNFSVADLENIRKNCEILPMVNQIKLHIGHPQNEIVEYCKKHNILVEAYSPLGRSKVLNHETIVNMANDYNVTSAQLCVRYVLEKEILPLPRSSNKEHIINNAAVDFSISREDLKMLDTLNIDSVEFGTPRKEK